MVFRIIILLKIFFRDNLDWLARATNWDKLSATASLGVIHRGHEKDSLALMQTYLPRDSANSSGFAEGGGLYALGLIHANHGGEITEYLLGQLKQGGNEPILTGGCLGLGLGMISHKISLITIFGHMYFRRVGNFPDILNFRENGKR